MPEIRDKPPKWNFNPEARASLVTWTQVRPERNSKRKVVKKGDPKNPSLPSAALMESIGPAHSADELRLPLPPPPPGRSADLVGFMDFPQLQGVVERLDEGERDRLSGQLSRITLTPERRDRLDALLARVGKMWEQVSSLQVESNQIIERIREEQKGEGGWRFLEKSRQPKSKSEPEQLRQLQKWADGRSSLREVFGFSQDELYSIARTAHAYYCQGYLEQARSLYQGLYALDPVEPYFVNALGTVELADGNGKLAVAAYDVAVKLAPDSPEGYVGRAEARAFLGDQKHAISDLKLASGVADPEHPLKSKIEAMLESFLNP